MKPYVIGLGEVLWDVLPEGKKLGGAPANFAYHVSQFGYDTMAVSAVGNDALGEETLEALNEKQLNFCMPRVDYPTGTVQVTLDDEGVPTYVIREGWLGTIFLLPPNWRIWRITPVRCVLDRLRSAAPNRELPYRPS